MAARMKLNTVNLLELLESPEYSDLLSIFTEKSYSKKEIIFFPYADDNRVFVVKSGRVRVYMSYEDKEFTLSILEAGDIYSSHTTAFTEALEESTLLMTDTRSFGEFTAKFPALALTMVKVLGDLLKNSISIINGLVFKESHMRLVELLIEYAEDKGERIREGIKVRLGLTMEELATVLGATRQMVSVLLNDLIKAGFIEKPDRSTILIKDLAALKGIIQR